SGERCRERRRHDPGDKKTQSHKPEHMRGDQPAKGILPRYRLKPRRDIKLGHDAKGHKARQHAQAEQCLNRHGVASRFLCPLFSQKQTFISAIGMSAGPEADISAIQSSHRCADIQTEFRGLKIDNKLLYWLPWFLANEGAPA